MVKALGRWMAVVLWMGGIFALSGVPSLEVPPSSAYGVYDHPLRKLAHVVEYAGLTILLSRAFRLHVPRPSQAWMLAGLVAGLYAVSDEWHQTWVPGRAGTVRDVATDSLGIMGALALASLPRVKDALRRWLAEALSS
jgi:VanZ family protein